MIMIFAGALLAAGGIGAYHAFREAPSQLTTECRENDVKDATHAYLSALMSNRYTDKVAADSKIQQVEARLDAVLQKFAGTMSELLAAEPHELTAEDLPADLPDLYRVRILNALQGSSPEHVAETVWAVADIWDAALEASRDSAINTLVPVHPSGLSNSFPSSPQSDAWLKKTRDQHLGNLYMARLLRSVFSEWEMLPSRYDYYRSCDIREDKELFMEHVHDHRKLLVPLLANLAQQEFLAILFLEAFPSADADYAIPETGRSEVAGALLDCMRRDSAFVRLNHQLLLQDYAYEVELGPEDDATIRKEVETKLELLSKWMETAYLAQLKFVCEALTLNMEEGFSEIDVMPYYENNLAAIQKVFTDDLEIMRKYASWIREDKKRENLDFIPPPPMQPMAIPSFMVMGTEGEGHAIHFYRKSGDAVRADVRRACKDALAEGYELLLGACYSRATLANDLRYAYMMSLLDDAEYAWMQYVHVMWELIAPLENSFWGSGTGIMVSEHMSAVYENHSRFYTDVLRIFPAGYSSSPDNEGETDEESNTESADS